MRVFVFTAFSFIYLFFCGRGDVDGAVAGGNICHCVSVMYVVFDRDANAVAVRADDGGVGAISGSCGGDLFGGGGGRCADFRARAAASQRAERASKCYGRGGASIGLVRRSERSAADVCGAVGCIGRAFLAWNMDRGVAGCATGVLGRCGWRRRSRCVDPVRCGYQCIRVVGVRMWTFVRFSGRFTPARCGRPATRRL